MSDFVKNFGIIIAASIALIGVLVTAVVSFYSVRTNLKTQKAQLAATNKQLILQQEMMNKQIEHQRKMAKMEHFLDKRTEAVLQFQKSLEKTRGILEYFISEPADLKRRQKINIKYKNPQAAPQYKENIDDNFILSDMLSMLDCALEQIEPIEEELLVLKNSLNLLVIYLEKQEEQLLVSIVSNIDGLQYSMIGQLRELKREENPRNPYITMFLHIGEPYIRSVQEIRSQVEEVRGVLKKSLYVHKLKN
ncbi:UNVERIFIED_ORG: hypothetical protein J2X74_000239 [Bacillus sp. 1751]|nr:hypothetical protein [Bacillus sp. 1751]